LELFGNAAIKMEVEDSAEEDYEEFTSSSRRRPNEIGGH